VIEAAIEVAIGQNIKTFDLGGGATTTDVGKAIAEIVRTI
jgi:isocitrate/isopropylmalate dehydrogenase